MPTFLSEFLSLLLGFSEAPAPSRAQPPKSPSILKTHLLVLLVISLSIILPTTLITLIVYIEYHRLPCSTPWVKRLRRLICIHSNCCCETCVRSGRKSIDAVVEVWERNLGKREVYGKLFKNAGEDGGIEGEKRLRDDEGVENGVAVLFCDDPTLH
ncbi:hypothetical protein B2J93_5682 [Marssonina coronariae]|uniref:Uncharacterized protein n=1 Tax=Diplocarpon coronariae TaxID=2795749 RepID=A0A218ZAT8_9HELO|nr:hypothetical protein B2J93_5682 [Marssonina coronariae]